MNDRAGTIGPTRNIAATPASRQDRPPPAAPNGRPSLRHRAGRRGRPTTGAALVLSMVDGRTGVQHLVAVETAALHRRSGRYPALCDTVVVPASLTTPPARDCQQCLTRAQAGAGDDLRQGSLRTRRPRLWWLRRARRARRGARGRAGRAVTMPPIRIGVNGASK